MPDRIRKALDGILERFETGDIPQAIAYTTYPAPDVPSASWSFLNRLLMHISGTADARGFRQWKTADRSVKKGAKAIYILVPRVTRRETDDEEQIITGFLAKPVFRFEDTNGEPLKNTTLKLPDLPLLEKAREWKISVKAVPGNYCYYGYFSEGKNEIALATTEETVFFHELAHAAYARLHKSPNSSDSSKRCDPCTEEIVAELSAAALCAIVGKTSDPDSKYLGNNYRYIKRYAKKQNLSPVKACLKVLLDVERTLKLILDNPCEREHIQNISPANNIRSLVPHYHI